MSCLDFYFQFYFIKYIKDIAIPETNKCLNYSIILGEYFCVIGCRLIMVCYVGHSVRELFFKEPLNLQKVPPYSSITSYMGGALIISLRPCPTQIV